MKDRTIKLEGTINTRDLGGLRSKDGRKIRKGLLIRTDCLYALTENDIRSLSALPARYDVDFRNEKEIAERPEIPIPGCKLVNLPIVQDHNMGKKPWPHETYGVEDRRLLSLFDFIYVLSKEGDAKKGMEQSYRNYVSSPLGQKGYSSFLHLVLRNEGKGAVLFHCADGKDRAGVGAMILLLALGIPFDTILEDYLETNDAVSEKREGRRRILHQHGVQDPLLSSVLSLTGVEPNWLQAAYDEMKRQAGSIDSYFDGFLHFDEKKRRRLQEIYLEAPDRSKTRSS